VSPVWPVIPLKSNTTPLPMPPLSQTQLCPSTIAKETKWQLLQLAEWQLLQLLASREKGLESQYQGPSQTSPKTLPKPVQRQRHQSKRTCWQTTQRLQSRYSKPTQGHLPNQSKQPPLPNHPKNTHQTTPQSHAKTSPRTPAKPVQKASSKPGQRTLTKPAQKVQKRLAPLPTLTKPAHWAKVPDPLVKPAQRHHANRPKSPGQTSPKTPTCPATKRHPATPPTLQPAPLTAGQTEKHPVRPRHQHPNQHPNQHPRRQVQLEKHPVVPPTQII